MCDNLDNYPKKDNIYEKFLQRLKCENGLIKCKKCLQNNGFVLLQRKDVFCRQCLYEYCCHKFRSTIGKSKAIHTGERVLIAFSAGINSSAMIDMISDGLNEEQHKRLRFVPSIVFIDESIILTEISDEEKEFIINKIKHLMSKTGWNCFMSSIEMSYRQNDIDFYYNINDSFVENQTSIECRNEFIKSFSSIKTLTSKQEFLKRMRCRLICEIANNEKFDKIFFGNNASNLAINLLSDISIGKGIQLQSESGFIDDRNESPILRPMREFTAKEITFYAVMRKLEFIATKTLVTNTGLKSSIQRMTETFVNGLQTEFPSTVYTIFKTGNKLKASDSQSQHKCIVCNSSIDKSESESPNCSAFEALRLTQILSNNSNVESESNSESNPVNSLSTDLCYSCQIISNEMTRNDDKFPKVFYKKVDKRDITEFLIDQNEDNI